MPIPARSRSHLLINFIAFEIGWFAAVLMPLLIYLSVRFDGVNVMSGDLAGNAGVTT